MRRTIYKAEYSTGDTLTEELNKLAAENYRVTHVLFKGWDDDNMSLYTIIGERDEEVMHAFVPDESGEVCKLCHYVADASHHVRGARVER